MAVALSWKAPHQFPKQLAKNCKTAWLEMRSDLCEAGWRGCLAWLGLCVYFLGLPVVLVSLLLLAAMEPETDTACMPDGSFHLYTQSTVYFSGSGYLSINYWDLHDFFQITLGFGALSFSEAKIIDVSWDIVSAAWSLRLRSLRRFPDCGSRRAGTSCVVRVASFCTICGPLHGSIFHNISLV